MSQRHGIPVHLDGSRLLNAAVALNTDVAELSQDVDSVNMCFSKGVGAPIGSVLAGTHELISKALRMRKALGGGWRKSGPLASAALLAMNDAPDRLARDHKLAKMFANALMNQSHGIIRVDVEGVHTNIVPAEVIAPNVSVEELGRRLEEVTGEESKELKQKIVVKGGVLNKRVIKFVVYSTLTELDVRLAAIKTCYVLKELSVKS